MSDCCSGKAAGVPAIQVGGAFELIDDDGHAVNEGTYHGRFVLLFFGFTNCRVVCPAVLSRLSRVIEQLGPLADRLQPLYITVDPERDSPAVMKKFLKERFPSFRGLTGTRENIDHVKRNYRVFARRAVDPNNDGEYEVPHSALSYLVGPDGKFITHFTDTADPNEILEVLKAHIQSANR